MILAVSPYQITMREAPALVALQLAETVVTLLPTPEGGAAEARSAAGRIATYRALTKAWQWTQPLWDEGTLVTALAGETPLADVLAANDAIRDEPALAPLRAFLMQDTFADEWAYLAAISADMLRAGPNPGLSVPVAAGIDRFAARHGAMVVRPAPVSVAQQAEWSMGRTVFTLSLPMLIQGDAERVLLARALTAEPAAALRELLAAAADPARAPDAALLRAAAEAYTREFEASRDDLLDRAADDEVRPIVTAVTISGVLLPLDAVLWSSAAVAEPKGGRPKGTPPPGQLSLVIKPMGVRAAAPAGRG